MKSNALANDWHPYMIRLEFGETLKQNHEPMKQTHQPNSDCLAVAGKVNRKLALSSALALANLSFSSATSADT